MDPKPYRINVLHILNPHLIWVELVHPNTENTDYSFEQIGIYGMLPLATAIDHISNEISSNEVDFWAPAATKIITAEIEKAKSVKFLPIFIDDTNSIFINKIHKFGEIIIKNFNNEIVKLSEVLNKSYFSYRNETQFETKLKKGSLNTQLNNVQKAQIITTLNDNVLKKIKINHGKIDEVVEEKEDFFGDTKKSSELKLTTENLHKHNAALNEHEEIFDANNDKMHKFFSTFQENATNVAEQSSELSEPVDISVEFEKAINDCFSSPEKDPIIPKLANMSLNNIDNDIAAEPTGNRGFSLPDKESQMKKDTPKLSLNINDSAIASDNEELNFNYNIQNTASKKKKNPMVTEKLIYGPPELINELYQRENQKYAKKNKNKYVASQETYTTNTYNVIKQAGTFSTINVNKDNEEISITDNNKNSDIPVISNTGFKSDKTDDYLAAKVNISPPKPPMEKSQTKNYKVPQFVPKHKIASEKQKQQENVQAKDTATEKSYSSERLSRIERLLKLQESKRNKEAMPSSADNGATTQNSKYVNYDSDNETTASSLYKRLQLDKQTYDRPETKHSQNNSYLHIPSEINHVNVFNNIDLGVSKFINKVVQPVLIVHSKMQKRIEPAMDLRDIYFLSEIRVGLARLSVKNPKMLQTVSWSCILRGYSMFMISPSGSGKTFGYLPSVCQLVIQSIGDPDFSNSHGPLCIIVCATSKSVTYIQKTCKSFLGTMATVLTCYPGVNEKIVGNLMANGCDIFICTPCSLVRYLNLPRSPLSLKRLAICVLDDCERIEDVFLNEISYFIQLIKDMLSKRIHTEQNVQYIVASRLWCPFMELLAKKAPNSVISISAYQETILYSKTKCTVSFVELSNKVIAAIQFIKEIDESKRSVIVCNTDNEVDILQKTFKSLNYVVFAADHNMTVETIYELNQQWEAYDVPVIGPILICCDENLLHLNITNATYLLHYSLPNLYSTFCKRFAVLTDNYPSIFRPSGKELCRIKIFVGEDNCEQLPKIVNFIKRCTKDIPEVINEMTAKILEEREFTKAKSFVPICNNLLSFGDCGDFWNCKERHSIFKQFDSPPEWLPTNGRISFAILDYINAATYSARLINHTYQGKTVKYDQSAVSLSLKMDMYYMNDNNKIPHGIPKIGDICAVSTTANHFSRCQVVKIMNYCENGNPHEVVIKLIDEENWVRSKTLNLYHLPDKFRAIKTYVVQIKLAGLQPKDRDLMFSDLARKHLKHLIEKNENIFMRGNIIAAFGNIVIVDTVEACQKLSFSNEVVVRYNFKEELLIHHAITNDDYHNKIRELCDKSDIDDFLNQSFENQVVEETRQTDLPNPCWAHLDTNEMSLIYFAYADNPEKFYVRLEKFQDCLDILTNDIQTYLSNEIEPKASIKVGDLVLAKFPDDNKFYRGRIDDIIKENNIKCFFVDHGDWRFIHSKDIFDITEKFITQLPFQAIECRLVGLKPFGENWTEFSTNWFCDFGFEENSNDLKELYVKYFLKEKAEGTGGHKYAIVVIDTSGETDVIVNNLMVNTNLAKLNESEMQYLHEVEDYIFKKRELNNEKISVDYGISVIGDDSNDNIPMDSNINKIKEIPHENKTLSKEIKTIDNVKDVRNKYIALNENTECSLLEKAWEKEAEPYLNRNYVRKVEDIIKSKNILENLIPEKPIRSVPLVHEDDLSDDWDLQIDCSDPNKIAAAFGFDIVPNTNSPSPPGFVKLDANEAPPSTKSNSTSSVQVISPLPNDIEVLDSDDSFDPEELNSTLSSQENVRKPKLYWDEKDKIVNIKFEVLNMEKYKIKIAADSVVFRALVNDIQYGFTLDLYGVVKVDKCTHLLKGHRVYIKLEKLVNIKWRGLCKEEKKNSWITYNPDSIEVESDSDELVNTEDRQETIKKIIEHSYHDDSDSDSDVNFEDDFARSFRGYE